MDPTHAYDNLYGLVRDSVIIPSCSIYLGIILPELWSNIFQRISNTWTSFEWTPLLGFRNDSRTHNATYRTDSLGRRHAEIYRSLCLLHKYKCISHIGRTLITKYDRKTLRLFDCHITRYGEDCHAKINHSTCQIG